MKDAIMQAVIFALAQSLIFYIYSAGYRFGAFLVVEERATYDEIFRYIYTYHLFVSPCASFLYRL